MGKQVVFLTGMDKVPENCWNCDYRCFLPVKAKQPDQLKKAYKNKRHPDCQLRLVDPENLQEIGKG